MLDAALGPQASAVRVATEMDFDANSDRQRRSTRRKAPCSRTQTERESYTGTRRPEGAAASAFPAPPRNVADLSGRRPTTPADGKYNKSKSTTNYEITEQNTKHIDAPGKVTRESASRCWSTLPPTAAGAAGTPAVAAAKGATYQPTPQTCRTDSPRSQRRCRRGRHRCRRAATWSRSKRFRSNPSLATSPRRRSPRTTVLGIPVGAVIAIAGVLRCWRCSGSSRSHCAPGRARASRQSNCRPSTTALAEELPAVRRASDARRRARYRRADPFRCRSHPRADDRIRHDRRQENPDSIAKLVKLWLAE